MNYISCPDISCMYILIKIRIWSDMKYTRDYISLTIILKIQDSLNIQYTVYVKCSSVSLKFSIIEMSFCTSPVNRLNVLFARFYLCILYFLQYLMCIKTSCCWDTRVQSKNDQSFTILSIAYQ